MHPINCIISTNIMGIFNNIFKRNNSTVTVQTTGSVPMSQSSQENTNITSALMWYNYGEIIPLRLSAVYAALSIISNSIATLPIYVKQLKDNERTIVKNHRIQKLFYNMLQSKHTAIKQLVWDLLLYGNAFLYIKRENGIPVKLIYMQHGDVNVIYKKEQDVVQYQCCNHTAVPQLVKQEDMLHFAKDTYDGINGRGFMFFAADILKLAGFTQKAATDFFGSGCNLTGILQFKRPLKPGQQEAIRSQWQQTHSASGGGLGVLEGDSEYIPIAQNSADAQMLETRQYNVEEIARFFNISPILLGDLSHNSYSSIEDSSIEFVQRTLLPIINLMEEEINRKLITNNTQYVDFDETKLLAGNKNVMADYYTKLASNAILTINECREALGYNPIEGADDLLIPYTDIEQNKIGGNGDEQPEQEQQ